MPFCGSNTVDVTAGVFLIVISIAWLVLLCPKGGLWVDNGVLPPLELQPSVAPPRESGGVGEVVLAGRIGAGDGRRVWDSLDGQTRL